MELCKGLPWLIRCLRWSLLVLDFTFGRLLILCYLSICMGLDRGQTQIRI